MRLLKKPICDELVENVAITFQFQSPEKSSKRSMKTCAQLEHLNYLSIKFKGSGFKLQEEVITKDRYQLSKPAFHSTRYHNTTCKSRF